MIRQGFYICTFLFFAVTPALSQNAADWFINLKDTIKQKEPLWEIKLANHKPYDAACLLYTMALKSGKDYLVLRIVKCTDSVSLKKIFPDWLTFMEGLIGERAAGKKLMDAGDEGYIWRSKNSHRAKVILRKKNFLIDIVGPSETLVRKFIQYTFEPTPRN